MGALYFVFSKIDHHILLKTLKYTSPYYVLLAMLVFVVSQLFSAERLHWFFKRVPLSITRLFNYKLYSLGLFYNLFLPGGIGGDGYKIVLLRKRMHFSGKKIFWAILLDRFSGLWALCSLLAILIVFTVNIPHIAIYCISIVALVTSIYYFLYQKFFKKK